MCLEAVKNDGFVLGSVPDKFLTYEMCLEAVKNDGWALKYVPEKFRTDEICLEVIQRSDSIYMIVNT
jgi:hypothetical protein